MNQSFVNREGNEFNFASGTLKSATMEEAVKEAVRKMKRLGFPDDVIENFKSDGNVQFRMENEKRVPLDAADRKAILMLNAAGYLVYAVVRTNGGHCTYVVSSRFKMLWDNERKLMNKNLFPAYSMGEFKVARMEIIHDGMMKQIWPEPKSICGADDGGETDSTAEKTDDGTVSADTIEGIRKNLESTYELEMNGARSRRSADRALAYLFQDTVECSGPDEFVSVMFQEPEAYRLTYGMEDYISLAEDLYLVSKGTIKEIIARSGLSKEEFCDRLGISQDMPDIWDSGADDCPLPYRFLMGRYLGIIRKPAFVRDLYSYAANWALSGMMPAN